MQDIKFKKPNPNHRTGEDSNPIFNDSTFFIFENARNYPFIDRKNRNKAIDCYENFEYLMDTLGIRLRYNLMSREVDVDLAGQPRPLYEERTNIEIGIIENIMRLNGMSSNNGSVYMLKMASLDTYHPVLDAITAKPWDGTPRFYQFLQTITPTNPQLGRYLLTKWMLQAIGCLLAKDGVDNHGVLVLLSPQGMGKTTWVKKLSIVDRSIISPLFISPGVKDSVRRAASYWIGEVGEIETMIRKSDSGSVKAYLTSSEDILRCPYAKADSRYPRRTVLVGTGNETEFLEDRTGNRRFWVLELEAIDYEHDLDMQQVWAEVYQMWQDGARPVLSAKAIQDIEKSNQAHETPDEIEQLLLSRLDWDNPSRVEKYPAEVAAAILGRTPNRSEVTRIGSRLSSFAKDEQYSDLNTQKVKARNRIKYTVPEFIFLSSSTASQKW